MSVTCIILVTGWSKLHKRLFHLLFACWDVCALVSHENNLSHLGVTCHQFDIPGGHLRTLHVLCKLPDLACGKLVQVYAAIIYCLGDKLLIFQEELKNVPVKYLGSLRGYLAKATWGLTALNNTSTDLFTFLKLVRRSNLALTLFDCDLQNPSKFSQIVSSISFSLDKLQETYCPCQNHHSKQLPSCIASSQVTSQAHTQGCSHTSSTI